MQSVHLRKYGAAATIDFELYEVDGVDFRVDAAHASGDTAIMKDEGAEANTTNSFTDEGNAYSIVLTATEMQAARVVIYVVDQTATKIWLDKSIVIETYGNASAQHAFDLDDSVRGGMTALPNAAADAAGGLPISDAGGLALDTQLAATNEVTAARMGALTDWINGGRLDLLLDAIKVVTDAQAATGTGLSAIPWNASWDAEVQSEVNDALVVLGLDHLVAVAVADEVVDDSIIAKMVDRSATADWSTYLHTEDSLRAISENVNSIGSASGGGFKFAALSDDVLEDLINNAGAAVDKGTTPATVGIPVTGAVAAGWLADDECTIALTTNYNGQHVIDSVSTNEIVIVATYNAETFGAADTIKRTIKATRLVGTEDSGTFASTSAIDGVVHQIGDTGNAFTISYRFQVGGGRLGTEADLTGFLNSGNDDALIQAYDFVASAWETRELLPGQGGSVNQTVIVPLLARNTGTSGVELGQVLMRIKDDGAGSSPTLNVDSLLVEAIGIGRSGAYQLGQIWIDTVNGTDGAELDTHGTSTIPCKTWANVTALVAAGLPSDVHVLNGSSVTFDAGVENYSLFGDHWTLALGGQACGGIYVQGATVTGIGTSAGEEMHFEGCDIGTATVEQGHFDKCGFTGTLTMNTADDYEFHGCYDKTAVAAIFTKTASVNITAEWVDWSGSITLSGIQASSSYILAGTEIGDIILNGADGTVEVRGIYKTITDNRTGSPVLTITGAVKAADVAATLLDTAEIGTAGAGLTDLGGMSTAMKAEVNTEMDDVLSVDTHAEVGQETPAATQSLKKMIQFLYKAWRNKSTQTATEYNLFADDATTVDQKNTVSDDATTATKGEQITGP